MVARVQIPKGIYIFSFQGYVGRDQPQNSDCQEWFHSKYQPFFFGQKIAKKVHIANNGVTYPLRN
jgi:hypothetical protein